MLGLLLEIVALGEELLLTLLLILLRHLLRLLLRLLLKVLLILLVYACYKLINFSQLSLSFHTSDVPIKSCMSARLHIADLACQLGCT